MWVQEWAEMFWDGSAQSMDPKDGLYGYLFVENFAEAQFFSE